MLNAAKRPSARQGAASPAPARQSSAFGAYRFSVGPSGDISYETLKGGGARFTLSGDAEFMGPGRAIKAQTISFDAPKGMNDVTLARASGAVRMTLTQANGRLLTAATSSLLYRRDMGTLSMDGGVHLTSALEAGGSVDATSKAAEVNTVTQSAVMNENVQLTLVKPDTLDGPGKFSGQKMTVDLKTGNWKLSGGGKGAFNIKPPAKTDGAKSNGTP